MPAVAFQKRRRDQPHTGQEVDQQRQLEHQRRGQRCDDDGRKVLIDVDHVHDRSAGFVIDEEADRERHDDEIAEEQAREEAGRDPEYEAVRGGDFALCERGLHETPELPEDVGHGQHETRHERDFHVQVELPRHGGIDNPEIEVRDVERFGIDAQRKSCQSVDPTAERGEAVSGLQQQPVGRETGALGAEKHHVDQEVPGEKCGDGDHNDSGGTTHQMGAQRREMGPEVHLRAFVSGVGFRHIGSLGNSRRAPDYLSADLSPETSAGFGFLFSDE